MNNHALILMSTYQGENYLAEQLDSLRDQTHTNWSLLIRDDGSTDNTFNIINEYIAKDSRVKLLNDNLGNVKPAKSFSILMQHALSIEADSIFFADQDDVWFKNKLSQEILLLNNMQNENSLETPLLVFSDLCVVDMKLNTIHSSYHQYENLNPHHAEPIKTLLVNNYITGCTIGMNKALLTLATPLPDSAIMHDWWCALNAAIYGKIAYLPEATLYYRQHSLNDIGSKGFYAKKLVFKKRINDLQQRFLQAKDLLIKMHYSNQYYFLIKNYSSLNDQAIFKRIMLASRLHLQPDGIIRKIGFWLLLLFVGKNKHA